MKLLNASIWCMLNMSTMFFQASSSFNGLMSWSAWGLSWNVLKPIWTLNNKDTKVRIQFWIDSCRSVVVCIGQRAFIPASGPLLLFHPSGFTWLHGPLPCGPFLMSYIHIVVRSTNKTGGQQVTNWTVALWANEDHVLLERIYLQLQPLLYEQTNSNNLTGWARKRETLTSQRNGSVTAESKCCQMREIFTTT